MAYYNAAHQKKPRSAHQLTAAAHAAARALRGGADPKAYARMLTEAGRERVDGRRRLIYERDEYRCLYCEEAGDADFLSLDHLIPMSKGGASGIHNIVTACRPCNNAKGDAMLAGISIGKDRKVVADWPLVRTQVARLRKEAEDRLAAKEAAREASRKKRSYGVGSWA